MQKSNLLVTTISLLGLLATTIPSQAAPTKKITVKRKSGAAETLPVAETSKAPCTETVAAVSLSEAFKHMENSESASEWAERKTNIEKWTQWWTNFGGRTTSQTEYERSLAAARVELLSRERLSIDLLNYVQPTVERVRLAWHRIQQARAVKAGLEKLRLNPSHEEVIKLRSTFVRDLSTNQSWYINNSSDEDVIELLLKRVGFEIEADEHVMLDRLNVYKGMIYKLDYLKSAPDSYFSSKAVADQVHTNTRMVIEALESKLLFADFFRDGKTPEAQQKTPTLNEIKAYVDSPDSEALKRWYLIHKRNTEMFAGISSKISTQVLIDATEKFFTRNVFNQLKPVDTNATGLSAVFNWTADKKQNFRALLLNAATPRLRRNYLPTIMRLSERTDDAYSKALSLANSNAGTANELMITFARIPTLAPLFYEIYGEAVKSVGLLDEAVSADNDADVDTDTDSDTDTDTSDKSGKKSKSDKKTKTKVAKKDPPKNNVPSPKLTPEMITKYRALGTLYRDMETARQLAGKMDSLRLEGGAFDTGITFAKVLNFMAGSGLAGYGLHSLYQYLFGFMTPVKATASRKFAGSNTPDFQDGLEPTLWEQYEVNSMLDAVQTVFMNVPIEEITGAEK